MFGICDVKDWITIAEYADISELLQINNRALEELK